MEGHNLSFSPEIPSHNSYEILSHQCSEDVDLQPISQSNPSDGDPQAITQPKPSDGAQPSSSDGAGKRKINTSLHPDPRDGQVNARRRRKTSTSLGSGKLFTEKDEITILRGLLGYSCTNNISDLSLISWNTVRTYLAGQGKLPVGLTTSQIYEKVRRLKKKYLKNLEEEKHGEGPNLNSDHDIEVFQISKKVWGGAGSDGIEANDDQATCEGEAEPHNYDNNGEETRSNYPYLCEVVDSTKHLFSMKENLKYIGAEKARDMEVKWMKIKLRENKLHIRKMKLESELTKILLNGMKSI